MGLKKSFILFVGVLILITTYIGVVNWQMSKKYGAPPYVDESLEDQTTPNIFVDEYTNWVRPSGPIRIGLQAGHWKTGEMPEELERIKNNGGGTTGQGVPEWQIVLSIAEETKKILEDKGYIVDILPATIPEKYWADAFISIHADGNTNPMVKGYKVAAYQRDRTGNASKLAQAIETKYGQATGFNMDPNVTKNMTRYYAFNYRRYQHSITPVTPGVIVETGFATNYAEVSVLLKNPEIPARGIAEGIIEFIESQHIKTE